MATTKNDLCQKIAEKSGIQHIKVKKIFQMTLDSITDSIAEDGHFELRNFGVFDVIERAPRKGRNPRTGESCNIAGSTYVRFKPGRNMANAINNND